MSFSSLFCCDSIKYKVMRLKLVAGQIEGEPDEETSLTGLAGGTCFDFNKESEHLYVFERKTCPLFFKRIQDDLLFV